MRAQFRNRRPRHSEGPRHLLFCIADHYEPDHRRASIEQQRERVARWVTEYPALASEFVDASGRPPQHTFFFPIEAYRHEHVDALAGICRAGFGEVEVHLHHGHDTSTGLRTMLHRMTRVLADDHGLLGVDADGQLAYGFVHGNWALDNGGRGPEVCGVNDEITILRETGCYADFTMPAYPSVAQSRVVNAIYYVKDDPTRPRSYDRGRPARVGRMPAAEDLLLIEGPLTVWWPGLPRVMPRIDSGMIDASPGGIPTGERFARWAARGISVVGRPDWIFIKVHTHGAPERNADVLLGRAMRDFHRALATHFNDGRRYCLHYVTAREMFNIAKAAEAGCTGDPSLYRDFAIRPTTRPATARPVAADSTY